MGPLARSFKPRLSWTLVTVAAVALFVAAGNWQRERMHTKASLRAQYDLSAQLPPGPLPDTTMTDDWRRERFRRVVIRGEYDAAHQILIDNRIRGGRAGYEVVTPLELDDGRLVLVDRGWIALGATRAVLPDVPLPSGIVTVQGLIAVPTTRYLELGSAQPAGALWQNLDPARFAQRTGLPVLPIVIEATAAPVPDDGLLREWPPPDFGIEQHRLYMLQWYALAALAVVLWLVLNWRAARMHTEDTRTPGDKMPRL